MSAHLVISSPSRSTTGLSTLIFGIEAYCLCASPAGIASTFGRFGL